MCTVAEIVPPTSIQGGTLPDTNFSISSRNVAGAGTAHLKEKTIPALDCSKKRLRWRVSGEENSNSANSATVIFALSKSCKVNLFCVSGINHCDPYVCLYSMLDP